MSNKYFRWFCYLLLAAFVAYAAHSMYKRVAKHIRHSKGFATDKVSAASKKRGAIDELLVTEDEKKEINTLLDQPFFFLGKGRQCYAFVSADGQYVLKLIQHRRFNIKNNFNMQKAKAKKEKFQRLLTSFYLAKRDVPDETGVVFVHIKKTQAEYKNVTILDQRGNLFTVDLDDVQFIIQKKASLLKPTIVLLMHQGKVKEAKKRINEIFNLLISCAKKGVEDTDGALIRNNNLGFLENSAIYIDTGKLEKRQSPTTEASLIHDMRRLRPLYKWLKKNYPELATYYEEERERAILRF